jgi:hypothetical protein
MNFDGFDTFTDDLLKLRDWLVQCGVRTVAMESTGVYWIPLFQILEAAGLEVCLVNARHCKNLPGRKTDIQDCQWLQYLHAVGLLRGSFRPLEHVCAVRTILRHRNRLVRCAADQVRLMHKALTQMNVQLQHVISDLVGVTGEAIVQAILAGERDPLKLTEAEVIKIMREHLEGLFPKVCLVCHQRYATLREYLQTTKHLGSAIPYDAESDDWTPLKPLGTVTYANCSCGSTLMLTSEGMALPRLWSLLSWARTETQKRGMTPRELLNYLREEICKQVLAATDQASKQNGENGMRDKDA